MLKVNEYGGRQAKGNEKKQCLKGWETLVMNYRKDIPEELLTTKKNICDEFARHGYNPNEIIFFEK